MYMAPAFSTLQAAEGDVIICESNCGTVIIIKDPAAN